jgi:GTP-binding protein Era
VKGYRSGFVALIGRPNVGKSTLLNWFVGEKVAIVSPRPQTTRRHIRGIRTTPEAQVIFVDTPGIHSPRHELGRYMVAAARRAIPDADVVLWVVDVSRLPMPEDELIARYLGDCRGPVILVMNKSDLLAPAHIQAHTELFESLVPVDEWMLTIATEGYNLDLVWSAIVDRLPEGPALYPDDQVSDQTDRMMVAELVRESALRYLREEVPHGVEVVIEDWEERQSGTLFIAAKVFVERESHKSIVIGSQGAMLKQIGSTARREIERALDRSVYLELFVAVRPGWRKSSSDLKRLGFD